MKKVEIMKRLLGEEKISTPEEVKKIIRWLKANGGSRKKIKEILHLSATL